MIIKGASVNPLMSFPRLTRHVRHLLLPKKKIQIALNELPQVPLVHRRFLPSRPQPHFGRAQRTRLVHSVAVSVEQPLLSARSECSTSRRQSSSLAKTSEMPTRRPFERLPVTVRPKHYVLSLVPDLEALTFEGDVEVQIEVVKQTDTIVLNALEIELLTIHLKNSNDEVAAPASSDLSAPDETLTLKFANAIPPGEYTLAMSFKGNLNANMKGLYRSKYLSQSGQERSAAVTQFEATDARRCFPCWDEPALKATFDITITASKDRVALSNMPVKKRTIIDDHIKYDFERTPIMSTYLVACTVGEYDYCEDTDADGVKVRVYTPKGKSHQGEFACEVATKVLPYYKEYFKIAYPLPKIDLIAVSEFSAGAMENWGLVTYRESCLLVDAENTSSVQKQWIALVVGHELAHQWFGNLVTMEWWTHLWLNEGYASFVEYLCVDHLFPEYDIWTQFVTDTYIRALDLDSLRNSHPIEVPVGHPAEIDEIFDDISYNKGASVIRMLHNYIGDDDFRRGMNVYLTRHQYKNTYTEDLWTALEEASSKPVAEVMSTWTREVGFPVIKVTTRPNVNNEGIILSISQRKFIGDGSVPTGDTIWMIPVSIISSKHPAEKKISTVLKTKDTEIVVPDVGPKDWIKINPGTVSFYRTQYDTSMLEKFTPAIKDKILPPLDRLGLLDDLFAMVQAGYVSTVEVLKLMAAFEDDENYTVWSSINNIIGKLNTLLSYTDLEEDFKNYQRRLIKKVAKRLGWSPKPDEPHLDKLLRGLILARMAYLDDDAHIAEAIQRFDAHVNSSQILPADLRSACYKTVMRTGTEETYTTMLNLYRLADLHEERDRVSRSLGAAKDKETLRKVLEFAISNEVRNQDTVFVIMGVSTSKLGREMAWKFFVDNWILFHERYKGYLLTRLVKYVTENFVTEDFAKEVETFFKNVDIPGTDRTVQQCVESIRLNEQWLQRDLDAIRNYLRSN